jgi:Flp pilus assembly pilin Flp
MLEYVILFGVLTVMVAVTLTTISSGGGQIQGKLKTYFESD